MNEKLAGRTLVGLAIEEAARCAPFTVFVADGLGPGWTTGPGWTVADVHFGAHEPLPVAEQVSIHYWDDGASTFSLTEWAGVKDPGPDWEAVVRDGRVFFVYAREGLARPARLRVELEGTWIELSSESFDRERLFGIARSLAAVTAGTAGGAVECA